ncbi:Ulp1 protease family, C-terminal catalytic domain [Sesbania bispinosa]|nr:Ulp1 protease family, C-terminal catalytic domain [Sesbania bispinosa]
MALYKAYVIGERVHVFDGYAELIDPYIQAIQITNVEGSVEGAEQTNEAGDDDFILEPPWERFILQSRMQHCLLTLCRDVGAQRPEYNKVGVTVKNRYSYYKYEVTMNYSEEPWIQKFMGRYARTEDFAREDAARVAINWLIPKIGKDVWDVHYTTRKELEKKVVAQEAEIDAMKAEINMLKAMDSSNQTLEDATNDFPFTRERTEGDSKNKGYPPSINMHPAQKQNESPEATKIGAWMETIIIVQQISHRLLRLERCTSKILTWIESSTTTKLKKNVSGANVVHVPTGCPARTNAIRIDLSDYEDLDDYSDEEEANVVMDVSSEDEVKNKRSKRKSKDACYSPPKTKKKEVGVVQAKKMHPLLGRRGHRDVQEVKGSGCRGKTPLESAHSTIKEDSSTKGKSNVKDSKSIFPICSDMCLTTDEVQVSTYIFALDVDQSEVVFKLGVTKATINDFSCFCPGRSIELDDDVLAGLSKENVARLYILDWMNPFTCLKYIYVPIKEDNGHIYLMVVSLEEQTIYHMDSNPEQGHLNDRRENIQKLSAMLLFLMLSEWFSISYVNSPKNIDTWDIKQITPPNEGTDSVDSVLWVLQWMAMDFAFQPNVHGVMQDNVVRMKTALLLLLGSHNELRKNLEARAEVYYQAQLENVAD